MTQKIALRIDTSPHHQWRKNTKLWLWHWIIWVVMCCRCYNTRFRWLTLVNVKVTYFATIRTLSKQHVETLSSGRQSTQPLQAKHWHDWLTNCLTQNVHNCFTVTIKCYLFVYVLLSHGLCYFSLDLKFCFNDEPNNCYPCNVHP